MATGIFLLFSSVLPDASFTAWGCRIPFLLSLVLVLVGLFVRLRISETPVFAELLAKREASRVPLGDILRRHLGTVLLGAGGMVVAYGLFYTATTYILSYATTTLGIGRTTMLALSMVAAVFLGTGTLTG